ncbi:MAG: hypothetical protein SGI97_07680 [candidate division Zixibacteria bacterium]|nr:hypothetical protein [candidate division Zixibacteria bacterium]
MAAVLFTQNAYADAIRYALSDIRVLYVYDQPADIDWPVLYYLNEEYGATIYLVRVGSGQNSGVSTSKIPDKEIFHHTYTINENVSAAASYDSLLSSIFRPRPPDIVLFSVNTNAPIIQAIRTKTERVNTIFSTSKIYEQLDVSDSIKPAGIVINLAEFELRYRERMISEIPQLKLADDAAGVENRRTSRYQFMESGNQILPSGPDFLSGMSTFRLVSLLDTLLKDDGVKEVAIRQARNYISLMSHADKAAGLTRVTSSVKGYKELLALQEQILTDAKISKHQEFIGYLSSLVAKAERAVQAEVGLSYSGEIVLRDSPDGPVVKLISALSVTGPTEVELSTIRFHPYWDSSIVVLDSVPRTVTPHQTFVREYLVDIDPSRLQSSMPESLKFSAELVYLQIPLTVFSTRPLFVTPELSIQFVPSFSFVDPVARINVDKVVSPLHWRVMLTKPPKFSGRVKLTLETPTGLFAGAYKQDIMLEKGSVYESIDIPFSVSNLFALGIQQGVITLTADNRNVSTDTGLIRIAECAINPTRKIAFLPDSLGLLEDILRMTDAGFQPLTDRGLLTADLDAYSVIAIGSGAIRDYPSLELVSDRITDFVHAGGTLLIFGQSEELPRGLLPFSFAPSPERPSSANIRNRLPEAALLTKPNMIVDKILYSGFSGKTLMSAARLSPAEVIYATESGAALLAVSRLGNGQVIYCGLPLLEMISQLNIEAIHLLSNILNY